MSNYDIPAPPAEFEQTRVIDLFPLGNVMCALTSNEDGTVRWWHLFNASGRSLGATNRPELIGALIHQAR